MKSFRLTDIQKKAVIQQNEIKNIVDYDWKNLNMIRLNPTRTISEGDTNIEFQLDQARLANNFPINRVRMNAKIKVRAVSDKSFTPPAYMTAYPFMLNGITPSSEFITPYLISPSNGALDSLFLNKVFSNIKIKNGANELREDKRTFEKIDLLTRFMDPEKLEKWGIYPDLQKGAYTDKLNGFLDGIPLQSIDPSLLAGPLPAGLDPTVFFSHGNLPDELEKNIFWKRNTNNQYINIVNNQVSSSITGGVLEDAVKPVFPALPDDVDGTVTVNMPYPNIFKVNPSSGDKEYYYQVFPENFNGGTNFAQEVTFDITEDLISDILTTRYSRKEEFRPLPSSLLSFNFNLSPLKNQLYKTSNPAITDISIEIVDMTLDFFTFNFGLLSIQPSTYYVPYYQEISVNQKIDLSQSNIPSLNTLKYNKMPTYIMFYVSEPLNQNQNQSMNLNTIPIENVKLQIDNDQGTSLFGLNKKELEEMTVNNLGSFCENFDAMYRTPKFYNSLSYNIAYQGLYNLGFPGAGAQVPAILQGNYVSPSEKLISGVYLLKIGRDIRIDPLQMASLNMQTSFNFNITLGSKFSQNNTTENATFNCIAFNPAYYIMNPETGLLTSKDISYTQDELLQGITETNQIVKQIATNPNSQQYTTESPQMMLGSGWFGGLNDTMRSHMLIAPRM